MSVCVLSLRSNVISVLSNFWLLLSVDFLDVHFFINLSELISLLYSSSLVTYSVIGCSVILSSFVQRAATYICLGFSLLEYVYVRSLSILYNDKSNVSKSSIEYLCLALSSIHISLFCNAS